MPRLVPLASVSDIPPGTGSEFTIEGRIIAVFNSEGTLHALDGICPHAGGPLAEGRLQGNVVTCPWHGWQFDVSTGRHCLNSRLAQHQYVVRQEGEQILIELPD